MKTYIRYLAITSKKNPLEGNVLCIDKKPPGTPYYKIDIRVLGHEKLFRHERGKGKNGHNT